MSIISWTPLNVENNDTSTTWLFKISEGNGGCEVSLTDLTEIWVESLTSAEVKRRAQELDCPIDPSQDDKQLENLLKRIKDMCLGTAPEAEVRINKRNSGQVLLLQLTCGLPRPLRSLHWNFGAELQGHDSFVKHVLMPLVHKVNLQASQLDTLTSLLAEKDSAISNIMDKFESSGIDITTVFPASASVRNARKRDKKQQLQNAVRGLKPFDAEEFYRKTDQHFNNRRPLKDSLQSAFREVYVRPGVSGAGFPHVLLSQSSPSRTRPEQLLNKQKTSESPEPKADSFAPLEPPLGLTSGSHKISESRMTDKPAERNDKVISDAETTEEEEQDQGRREETLERRSSPEFPSDRASKRDPSTPPQLDQHPLKPIRRRIGTIGNRKKLETEDELPTSDQPSPVRTGSDLRDVDNPPCTSGLPRFKPRIGTVGGRRASPESSSSGMNPTTDYQTKLGNVSTDTDLPRPKSTADSSKPKSVQNSPITDVNDIKNEAENLSTGDKADPKREKLKRELELKSKSQTKKKRKF